MLRTPWNFLQSGVSTRVSRGRTTSTTWRRRRAVTHMRRLPRHTEFIYVAEATRRGWRELETRHNFQIIRHGIPRDRLAEEVTRWTRKDARARLGVRDGETAITIVGTVCRRKGQLDLVEAFSRLPGILTSRIRAFIAGAFGEPGYTQRSQRGDLRASGCCLGTHCVDRPGRRYYPLFQSSGHLRVHVTYRKCASGYCRGHGFRPADSDNTGLWYS